MQKSVLITGCSSGIGKCAAEYLQKRQWHVYATARKENDVQSLRDSGFSAYRLDLTDSNSINICAEQILSDSGGKLNAIIHNAGILVIGAIEDISRDGVREQFETNVFGPIELTQRLILALRAQQDGKIIFISSPNSNGFGYPFLGVEAASKAALETIASAFCREAKESDISISSICLGEMHTPILTKAVKFLKNYVNVDMSIHKEKYQLLEKNFLADGITRPNKNPLLVAQAIEKILNARHPPRRIFVPFSARIHYWLHFLLPGWAQDKLLFSKMKKNYSITMR